MVIQTNTKVSQLAGLFEMFRHPVTGEVPLWLYSLHLRSFPDDYLLEGVHDAPKKE